MSKTGSSRRPWLILGSLLLLLCCVCAAASAVVGIGLSSQGGIAGLMGALSGEGQVWGETGRTPRPTPLPLPPQTMAPRATAAAPTGAAPAQSATAVSIAGPAIDYGGIRFTLHPSSARGVSARTVPEIPPSPETPFWEVNPEYVEFILDGYPAEHVSFQAQINVFPVEAYTALVPDVALDIDALRMLLASKPPAPEVIPIPHIRGAAQVFRARVHYLPFRNGTGVGFITQYAQDTTAIYNGAAFYAFQGLTDDDAYYISAILPITTPLFGTSYDDFDGYTVDFYAADMADRWEAYLDGMTLLVNQAQPEAFTPSLGALDEMLQSLQVR